MMCILKRGNAGNRTAAFFLAMVVLLFHADPGFALGASSLTFSHDLLPPRLESVPFIHFPGGQAKVEILFRQNGSPFPVPEKVYDEVDEGLGKYFSSLEKNLKGQMEDLAKEAEMLGKKGSQKTLEKDLQKPLEELNRFYLAKIARPMALEVPGVVEKALKTIFNRNPAFRNVTPEIWIFLDDTVLPIERPFYQAVYVIGAETKLEPALKKIPLFECSISAPEDETLAFCIKLPMCTREFLFINEATDSSLEIDLPLPLHLGDKEHSAIYSAILKKLEGERGLFEKTLQEIDEQITTIVAQGKPEEVHSAITARSPILHKTETEFRKKCMALVDQMVRDATGKPKKPDEKPASKDEPRHPPPPGTEIETKMTLLEREIPEYSPERWEEFPESLKQLKFEEKYSEFRKTHTQSNGGIALSIGMLRDTMKVEKAGSTNDELFSKKSVANFYQAAFNNSTRQLHKLKALIPEVRDVSREISLFLCSSLRTKLPVTEQAKFTRLRQVLEHLGNLLRYLVYYQQALEHFLAIEPQVKQWGYSPKNGNSEAVGLRQRVFAHLSAIGSIEMGDSRGNSADFLNRMGMFQTQSYLDSLDKLADLSSGHQ